MYKEDKDKEGKKFIEEYKKAIRSGKNLDSGIHRDSQPKPNETINEAIGAPKGTIIKPVEMPSRFGSSKPRTKMIDGEEVPVEPASPKTRGNLELLKKGGKIDLKDCKVNTSKKNSSSPKW
jgi:hypothetical protein